MDGYGTFSQCSPGTASPSAAPFGVTVAGSFNGTPTANDTLLYYPRGIELSDNGTLYVADGSYKLMVFTPNSRVGDTFMTYSGFPALIALDNSSSRVYVSVPYSALVQIWPSNATIPPNAYTAACSMDILYFTIGVQVDGNGNVYIASSLCHWVTVWAPNATNGSLVAGLATATAGNDSQSLNWPFGLFLDEVHASLYVVDYKNHRIQKFDLSNSTVGVTVAGGNGAGSAANQLNSPISIAVSHIDGAIYIADRNNNRVQKWLVNAAFGITVAGSSTAIAGNSPYLLNWPFDIKLAYGETYLYVSDYRNHRIQRFALT